MNAQHGCSMFLYAMATAVTCRDMPWHVVVARDICHDIPRNDYRGKAHGKRHSNPLRTLQ